MFRLSISILGLFVATYVFAVPKNLEEFKNQIESIAEFNLSAKKGSGPQSSVSLKEIRQKLLQDLASKSIKEVNNFNQDKMKIKSHAFIEAFVHICIRQAGNRVWAISRNAVKKHGLRHTSLIVAKKSELFKARVYLDEQLLLEDHETNFFEKVPFSQTVTDVSGIIDELIQDKRPLEKEELVSVSFQISEIFTLYHLLDDKYFDLAALTQYFESSSQEISKNLDGKIKLMTELKNPYIDVLAQILSVQKIL
ncbi:MAG: hypothetical protein AB8G05_27935 [Oligoflexales bacterium]